MDKPAPPGYTVDIMEDTSALVHRRAYLHCGWAVVVPPGMDEEFLDGRETLRLSDDDHEVSLGSMILRAHDGQPWKAEEVLAKFPPPEWRGLPVEHEAAPVKGRGILLQSEAADGETQHVLMGLCAVEAAGKLLRITIVVRHASQRGWATEVFKSVRYPDGDMDRLIEMLPERPVLVRTSR